MQLSANAIQEYKKIFKKEYGVDITDSEAQEQGTRLLNFVNVLYECAEREAKRKRRLEKEPGGFNLEEDGSVYNCLICHQNITGKQGWWDEWGQKCLDCQRNIKEGVIPPEICRDRDSWMADWEMKSKFGLHSASVRKIIRTRKLKVRNLKTKGGTIYFRLFMSNENIKFLKTQENVKRSEAPR